jgi:hypothetical protein
MAELEEGQEPIEDEPVVAEETPEDDGSSIDDELMAYDEGDPDDPDGATTPEPEPEGEPVEAQGIDTSVYDLVLPDDPNLPKPYRGKMTVGGIIENERKLLSEYNKAREEANTLTTKLQVQNHVLESLRAAGLQPQGEGAVQAVQPDEAEIWKQYGVNDIEQDLFDKPKLVIDAMLRRVRDEHLAAQQPIKERIDGFDQAIISSRNKTDSQTAWMTGLQVLGRDGSQISEDAWVRRSPEVFQMVAADYQRWASDPIEQGRRPDPTKDPVAYAAAYKTVMSRWADANAPAAATAAPVQATRPKQPDVSNPPHAVRSGGASTTGPKVSSRMEAEIKEWAKEWNMPIEDVREMYLEVENEGA